MRNSTTREADEIFRFLMDASPMSGAGLMDGKRVVANPLYVGEVDIDGLDRIYGQGYQKNYTNVLNFDLVFTQKLDMLTEGLKFALKGSYNSTHSLRKIRSGGLPTYKPYQLDDGTVVLEKSGGVWNLGYQESSAFNRDWYAEASIDYKRTLGPHEITSLLLYNQSKTYYPSVYEDIARGYVGLVGRVTYNYALKYLFDFNMGYNGSENFAKGKRYGFFPSASAGWIASSEKFMQNQKVISYLKFRYSYGIVGNDNMLDSRFLYLPGVYFYGIPSYLSINNGYNFGTNDGTYKQTIYDGPIGNPDVTWETAAKQNVGVDAKFLDDRLSLGIDIFTEKRKDILISISSMLPAFAALSDPPKINYGKVHNKGYELTLSWRDKIGDFGYNISPSLTYNKNKIVEQMEIRQDYDHLYKTGHPVGQPFGYEFWGFYEGPETADKYMKEFGVDKFPTQIAQDLKPGDAIYVDLTGDGKVDFQDMHAIGYPDYPQYNYSMNLGFEYKNFDLTMWWSGASNVSRVLSVAYRPTFGEQGKSSLPKWIYDNSWTEENRNDAILPRITFSNQKNNTADSRLWIKDASYLRLKNIEIGYSFTNIRFMKAIRNVRLYANGYNVLTFSKFKANDPENTGGDYANPFKYPQMRVFNIGLKVNL